MKYLVGETPMEQGQRVEITFSDGKKKTGVYSDTYGYNHSFDLDDGGRVTLSNHFMRLKSIRVRPVTGGAEENKNN